MVLALVCLWVGFALGFVCAALMAGRAQDRRPYGDAEPGFAVEVHAPTRPFRIVRVPLEKRRAAREEIEQDR